MNEDIGPIFDEYISKRLSEAEKLGWTHLILRSGPIHKDLQFQDRLPSCCHSMRRALIEGYDEVLHSPPQGNGTTLTILYQLPRR